MGSGAGYFSILNLDLSIWDTLSQLKRDLIVVYFGYFGRFTLDVDAATVTHHIDAGWFPNLTGVDQVRHYDFDGDALVLSADTPWGRARLVWRRPDSG